MILILTLALTLTLAVLDGPIVPVPETEKPNG